MSLPKDPVILLSVVNTKLRDFYPSLDNLCDDLQENKEAIIRTLKMINNEYDEKTNQFI